MIRLRNVPDHSPKRVSGITFRQDTAAGLRAMPPLYCATISNGERHVALSARTIVERNSLFRGLPSTTLEQIAALATRRQYEEGAVVFLRGDPGDALYGVVTGRVRISASAPGGKEVFLNVMEPGETFGEIALLDGDARTATATTMARSELAIIQREPFLGLLRKEPQLAVHLIKLLCKRVRWTSELMEDSTLLAVPARLAKRVLSLASVQARGAEGDMRIAISQEELAQFLGLSRQIVNQHLQTWRGKGWVTLGRGSITVSDERALRSLAAGD
jgi:CRP/FNR family transcriptional regulator, cyclic AMP receptor protein